MDEAERLRRARAELEMVMQALGHHEATESTPVEVRTEAGWVDMTDLLQPLETMLG